MSRESYLVRSEVLAGFDDLVRELGGNPSRMYRRVELTEALMSNPDHMVPCANVSALLDTAARELGRSDFGLLLGARRKVFQVGLLWPLISHCPSVEQALKAATEHLHLHNRGILWQLDVKGNHAMLTRVDRVPSDVPTFQWAVYSTCSMFAGLKALCGQSWRPSAVGFIHPAPADSQLYDRFFGVKVEFNREFNLIDFPASDLAGDLHKRNSSLYGQLSRQIQALEEDYAQQEDFCSKVKLLIEQRVHTAQCTQTGIAEMMSMHPKTLQRELSRHGVTFRELKAEVRLDMAERYLQDSELPLTTVADILGFSELSSFSHAFKARHDLSPAEWRRQAKAEPV
ncbi:AraC family transcriptional regulator [Pseudohalioglobus sediminis]|uniref:AraC family transcriptional regulator n=1 Tax=Pseudohalioglobus sediminis TaxID=2606449 RepID=A0A5B0X5Y6_9GAMM|nr:AraC family transcriptional regulator [Pseudohalioglobus sediminis]KAA1193978.1 AraC family transcriptional regulator [Pseudohalioglobus sediminis]